MLNSAVFLGFRPVLTHSPPYFVTGKNFLRISWRSVDVIALSPIGVRVIGDEPFISLHEFTHDPNGHSTSILERSTSIFECCSR